MIDCGSDALRAIQKYDVDLFSIQRVFITHMHADHCGGLPAVLTAMHVAERKESIEIYVPATQLDFTRTWLANIFIYNGRISFETALLGIDDGTINLRDNVKLKFIRTNHLDKYIEYAENIGIKVHSFSAIVHEGDKKFYFSSDVGSMNEVAQHLDGSLSLVEAAHPALEEIADIAKKTKDNIYFTHIPQELEPGGSWRKQLRSKFGVRKLKIVHDGQILKI